MMSKIVFWASARKCSTQVGWSYENAPTIFGFEVEGVFAGDKNQNMPKISFKGDAKNLILGGWCNDVVLVALCWTPEAKAFLTDKPGASRAARKQIKISFKDGAGDIKGGQARPRTKIEPRRANQIPLPPPGCDLVAGFFL